MITISSELLTAQINPMGAELHSLHFGDNEKGHNILWQRDPNYWPKSAPILFPIVGVMKDNQYHFNGRKYSMPKHGLVRGEMWEVVDVSESQATFKIESTQATLESYPFHWELMATFRLEKAALTVAYTVRNKGETPMYFSFGSHPALALDFGSQVEIEDYFLRIFRPTDKAPLKRQTILSDGLHYTDADIGDNGCGGDDVDSFDIQIQQNSFDQDALIFTEAKISKIELRSHSSERFISFETGSTPDLGIWAKPGAAYVCLEPWFGYDDPANHNGDLTRKPGIQTLAPSGMDDGCDFSTQYTIELSEHWLT